MSLRPYLRFARSLVLRDRPVYAHYAVTSRCNLRCRSCVIWQRDEPELSTDEVAELAIVLERLGCVQLSLGGGEPALRKDLPRIVQLFQSRQIRTRVLTNGVAMKPAIGQALVDAGLREVSFSLDSLVPEVQDGLDNTGATYHTRMRNLLALARILPRRGSVPVLNTVVTPRNYRELIDIIDFADEIGFYVSLIPIHLAAEDDEHRFYSGDETLRFGAGEEAELRDVYRRIIRIKRRGGRIINSTAFLERSPDYLISGSAPWPCRAGTQFVSIGPDGRVSPCHAFEGEWGIHFRDFERAFHGDAYRAEVRDRIAGCEGCFRPCWAEIGLLMGEPRSLLEMARSQAIAARPRPRFSRHAIAEHLGVDLEVTS
jgi:MoaA/NifB/PqqE/SkfB family radical SAM enzyme